jgi:hypothetical protein
MDDVTIHIDELVLGARTPVEPADLSSALRGQTGAEVPSVLVEAAARAITGSVLAGVPEHPR